MISTISENGQVLVLEKSLGLFFCPHVPCSSNVQGYINVKSNVDVVRPAVSVERVSIRMKVEALELYVLEQSVQLRGCTLSINQKKSTQNFIQKIKLGHNRRTYGKDC